MMDQQLTDATRPDTPATVPPSMAFRGESACGPVGLMLPRAVAAHAPASGAEQVLRLAQAEPLIQAVEQWLHAPWDPQPLAVGLNDADADADAVSGEYRAVVRDPALAPPGSTLTMPLDALHLPPPESLRAPALSWASQLATVVLGEVPPEALAQLQVGGVLWLPGSFAAAWDVRLVDPAGQLAPCAAALELAAQRITVPPLGPERGVPADAADAAALQVVLARTVSLPLDHWLGWGRAGAAYHWPTPQPWAAELRQGPNVWARGALLPLGDGCGLYIESVEQPALAV